VKPGSSPDATKNRVSAAGCAGFDTPETEVELDLDVLDPHPITANAAATIQTKYALTPIRRFATHVLLLERVARPTMPIIPNSRSHHHRKHPSFGLAMKGRRLHNE
jgi:hypothetical protein